MDTISDKYIFGLMAASFVLSFINAFYTGNWYAALGYFTGAFFSWHVYSLSRQIDDLHH